MIFREIICFRLVTADPVRLAPFYRAIGFEIGESLPISSAEMALLGVGRKGARLPMSIRGSRVDLDHYDSGGRAYPRDATVADVVFQHFALVTDDIESAWRQARDAGATLISREGAVTLPPSAGGVTAVKFRDPEGHPLEFLQFQPGAKPQWTGAGVMGIDHSAISVGDVSASRRFYADSGLHCVDSTVNRGPTQEALDGLDDVLVDVVPMVPDHDPPHVELLAYRRPIVGPRPPAAVNDVAATRIVWRSDRDALIRDPDGHFHELSR